MADELEQRVAALEGELAELRTFLMDRDLTLARSIARLWVRENARAFTAALGAYLRQPDRGPDARACMAYIRAQSLAREESLGGEALPLTAAEAWTEAIRAYCRDRGFDLPVVGQSES